jgi:hypothetical protein
VLVAMTIGLGGTTGVSAVLAVDPPSTVAIAGTLVDQAGTSLPGVHLVITEELPPDGGFAGFQARTGPDGSFSATLFAWGTADVPAEVRIDAPQDESITLVVDEQCSRTLGVVVADARQLALGDPATAPKTLDIVATSTVLGEACGTTATPPTTAGSGNTRGPATQLTPPPTDGGRTVAAAAEDRIGPALALGCLAGLIGAASFLVPRPRARRRR